MRSLVMMEVITAGSCYVHGCVVIGDMVMIRDFELRSVNDVKTLKLIFAAGCYGVHVITTVNTDVDGRISTIVCELLLWSHFKQEKKQQAVSLMFSTARIGSRLEQVYVWFLDSDSIKFLKAIFGIIEELITEIIVYYLFEDEVEFHRSYVAVLSVSFNRINEDSIKRLRSTYTWVLQGKVFTTASHSIPVNAARTNIEELILAQTLIEIKAAKPKAITTAATTVTAADTRSKGIVMQEPSEIPSPKATISSSQPS
ncbi:hypothetical protein Tco_0686417 [Tanacetum coccineum]